MTDRGVQMVGLVIMTLYGFAFGFTIGFALGLYGPFGG